MSFFILCPCRFTPYLAQTAHLPVSPLYYYTTRFFSIVECFTTKDCLSWSCASKDAFLQIIPAVYERNTIDTMIKRTTNLLTFKVTCIGLRKVDKTNFRNFIARWLLVCPQRWKKQNTPVFTAVFDLFFLSKIECIFYKTVQFLTRWLARFYHPSIRVQTDKFENSDLHALLYANRLLVRVRLACHYFFPVFDQSRALLL